MHEKVILKLVALAEKACEVLFICMVDLIPRLHLMSYVCKLACHCALLYSHLVIACRLLFEILAYTEAVLLVFCVSHMD